MVIVPATACAIQRHRIVSVDDDLLPNEIHVAHSARSVSQADPPTDPNANCCDRLLEGVDERDLANRVRSRAPSP
jgi:hypothetical protein